MESTVVIGTVCKCSVSFFFQEQDKIAFPCPSKLNLVTDMPWPMKSERKLVSSRQEL